MSSLSPFYTEHLWIKKDDQENVQWNICCAAITFREQYKSNHRRIGLVLVACGIFNIRNRSWVHVESILICNSLPSHGVISSLVSESGMLLTSVNQNVCFLFIIRLALFNDIKCNTNTNNGNCIVIRHCLSHWYLCKARKNFYWAHAPK